MMRGGSGVVLRAIGLTIALALAGCTPDAPRDMAETRADTSAEISVSVSIPPEAFFVERIAGDHASVQVLVEPGQSPATYEPTPAQMATLENADVFFRIGVPFEDTLMERISASMPDLNVVDLREGIDLQPVSGSDGEHSHGRMDPHTWLDPGNAAIQARTIAKELARIDPERAGSYDTNLEALLSDIEAVNHEIQEMLAPLKGSRMFVFHPAFGYFTRAYGLEQVAIEIEGREPAPRELQRIIERAEAEDVRAIFVQPQFSNASARAIAAEVDATIVRLDPLARDYLQNLREMARKVRDNLGAGDGHE